MSGQIFISYRREESRWSARSLHDRLCKDFDPKQLFMDIDAIALGEDFVGAIETTVAKCDVLIAVIGNNWLSSKDDHGNRRLDNPEDFVRMEIGAALKRKIRVIPVLVDGALMPQSTDLPEDLKPLVRRNALLITETSFDGDCQRLAAAIRQVLEKAAAEERERLGTEQREREEPEARQPEEKERLEGKQREKERLEAEQRNKQRLEAEQRETASQNNVLPTNLASARNLQPAQAETAAIVQGKGLTIRMPSPRVMLLAVLALILVVGLTWFASRRTQETALVTPTPTPESAPTATPGRTSIAAPTPTPIPSSTLTPAPTANASSDAAGHIVRGNADHAKNDYDKAISEYGEAIKFDPENPVAYNNRGNAYYDKKDYIKAISDYNEAIKLNPKYINAYNNRGNAYYDKKDYVKAISDYSEAIRLDPENAKAYNNRGNAYYHKKDYDEAISDYNKAILLNPKFTVAYNNRGYAYRQHGNEAQAQADFDKAKELGYTGSAIGATPNLEEVSSNNLNDAAKDHPWINSLGMKFVPVSGTQVLFSVWVTRVQDFEIFPKSASYDCTVGVWSFGKDGSQQRGATWKEPGFSQGPNYPVVGVSWNDAEEFCKWLTKRERSAGDLPQDREYRLPTDAEWSAAVGLQVEVGDTPEEKSAKVELYPWDIPHKRDRSWPPPARAGNYAGEEVRNGDWPSNLAPIEGYNDGYQRTSPVGAFPANQFGLYDMGGNVWQWCEDWYNFKKLYRVWRGASWESFRRDALLASYRRGVPPDYRCDFAGFRCVVAAESSR
jgi:formylglycine-generating enzyme required for sulfatase activity/tetratricopeptide (TPR) repeat protein